MCVSFTGWQIQSVCRSAGESIDTSCQSACYITPICVCVSVCVHAPAWGRVRWKGQKNKRANINKQALTRQIHKTHTTSVSRQCFCRSVEMIVSCYINAVAPAVLSWHYCPVQSSTAKPGKKSRPPLFVLSARWSVCVSVFNWGNDPPQVQVAVFSFHTIVTVEQLSMNRWIGIG